jgi:hypothetical protein
MTRTRSSLGVLATLLAVLAVLGAAQLGGGPARVPPSGEPPTAGCSAPRTAGRSTPGPSTAAHHPRPPIPAPTRPIPPP